ncbi:hypothetical protein OG905_08885 [Streptomyces sp. NBC_00322]|uniref:hypothetical protein n=1 Tax=Streptomyces sp. NBC_00322 TaxID=2975712 RepID=UPI002E286B2F|nr:hypothetical protein [Streptomyces sp. NBC_00322]
MKSATRSTTSAAVWPWARGNLVSAVNRDMVVLGGTLRHLFPVTDGSCGPD